MKESSDNRRQTTDSGQLRTDEPACGQPLNVLLVENDAPDAELCLRELKKAGFEVSADVVETLQEVDERLSSKSYDIVLADYNLPGWNGMEALEHLQQEGRDIPFILVTGSAGEEIAVECIKKGAADYLLKDRLHRLPLAIRGALKEKFLCEERARAERALRASEERYRLLFERNLAGVYSTTLEGRILDLNEACARMFGYASREEAMTHTLWDISPSPAEMQALIALVQKQKAFANLEVCLRRIDGRPVWVLASANLLEGEKGNPPVVEGTLIDITERKQADAALRESEVRYRRLFESAKDGILLLDADTGQVTDVNPFLMEMLGHSHEAFLGKHLWDIGLFKDVEASQDAFRRLQESGYIRYEDLPLETSDGRRIEVEFVGNLYQVDSKEVIQCNIRDITERKRAEEEIRRLNEGLEQRVIERTAQLEAANKELKIEITERERAEAEQARLLRQTEAAEARFRRLLESAPDAIVISNSDGHVVLVNRQTEAAFGCHRDELLGKRVGTLVPERFRKAYAGHLATYYADPRGRPMVASAELYAQRKDGSEFPVEISLSPMESEGKVLVTSVIRDVSKRKRAEEVLEQLRRQNELILGAAGEGICGIGLDGIARFVNPAAARMIGWESEDLVGKAMHDITHHSRPDGTPYPKEECPISLALQDGTARSVSNEVFWRRDGSSFPVEYLSTPIREKGEIVGAVVTFRDITERREVERMKDEFISVVGHELRTPLTSIHGALGLMASGRLGALSVKGQRMLEIAVANTDRLVRLINDILDIERIESGKVTMSRQTCDAVDLITQAADAMQAMAEKVGVTLSVNPQSHRLWADPDRIIQGLTNLLSNAIKFSPRDGTVWLTVEKRGDEILFQVKDQGRGIPKDKLESIFERFQQVDASDPREKGGTGLGLSICRSIVKQHGGRIWAESKLGQGSSFFFTLPHPASPPLGAFRAVARR